MKHRKCLLHKHAYMMQLWQICWFNSSLANINFLFSIEISENLNESAPCSSWYTFYIEYLYKIMRAAFLFYFLSKINGVAASASLSFYMNIIYMCKSAPFLKRVGLHRSPFTLFQEREFVSSGRSNTTNTHTGSVFPHIYVYKVSHAWCIRTILLRLAWCLFSSHFSYYIRWCFFKISSIPPSTFSVSTSPSFMVTCHDKF